MSDLADGLLQQILEELNSVNRTLGEHGAAIAALRMELTGPSGKNGRLGTLETDVKELSKSNIQLTTIQKTLRYAIDVGIAIAASFGYHHSALDHLHLFKK